MMVPALRLLDDPFIFSRMLHRPTGSHKGTFGTALCLCGSRIYRGAALLAVEGAMRCGAGIVQLASVEEVISACCSRLPECTLLPLKPCPQGGPSKENLDLLAEQLPHRRALLAGCGLTQSEDTSYLVHHLVEQCECSVVLDADALNVCKSGSLPHPKKGGLIVTPHPGEMSALTGKSIQEIQQNRVQAALDFARENQCIIALKGHHTIIASPDGQVFENPTGNPGLAKGGSGDVLAGMITGLVCGGLSPLDAAICGVYLHGKAADLCAEQKGQTTMLPHDILEDLGGFLAENHF